MPGLQELNDAAILATPSPSHLTGVHFYLGDLLLPSYTSNGIVTQHCLGVPDYAAVFGPAPMPLNDILAAVGGPTTDP